MLNQIPKVHTKYSKYLKIHINGQIVGSLGLIGFWLTAIRNSQYGQNAAVSQLLSLVVHKRDVKWQMICGTI